MIKHVNVYIPFINYPRINNYPNFKFWASCFMLLFLPLHLWSTPTAPLAPDVTVKGNGMVIALGDDSPSPADATDFGAHSICADTLTNTFTIVNTGMVVLNVSAITLSGAQAMDYSVGNISFPVAIAAGDSVTFTIRFIPGGLGIRAANVSIANDDMDENPYDFAIQGLGIEPEINLKGNGMSIADGDVTPALADHTDFGSTDVTGGTVVRTFKVFNAGPGPLTVFSILKGGANQADFFVGALLPAGPVGVNDSAAFTVTFNPSAAGLRNATIFVRNNDCDEAVYDFAVQGTGLAPEMNVAGNMISIADGDATPSATDLTDFGLQCVSTGAVTHVFTIENSGTGNLNLTGMPIVSVGGAHAADFTVSVSPLTPVAVAGSTTFSVAFNPSTPGIRSATISISNDDLNENPYNFSIQGVGLDIFPTISGSTIICSGATANLTVSITGSGIAPYTVVYTDGSSNFTVTNYNSGNNIPVSPATTKTYTLVSVTDASGCAATAGVGAATVTVNPIPDVIIPISDQTVCNGANTAAINFLGSVMGTFFIWANNNPGIGLAANGVGDINAFMAINNGIAPVTATVTVTPSAGGCTGTAQTLTITVNPTPDVAAPPGQTLCAGTNTLPVLFAGSVSGTTFSWTNDDPGIGLAASGTGNIASFVAMNNVMTPLIATVAVTPVANTCAGAPQLFTYTVNPTPQAADPPDQALCHNASTAPVIFVSGVGGTTFAWTNDNTSIGLAASGAGNIPSFAAINFNPFPVTATVTVTPTASGCTGPNQSFTIIVNPNPDVADPADQTVCHGSNTAAVNFVGSVSGTTYFWTNDNTGIGLAATGVGDIPPFAAQNPGLTPVTANLLVIPMANGCPFGPSQTFTITVKPTPTVADPPDQFRCNGENTQAVIFTGNQMGATYAWTNNNPGIGLAASGTGDIGSFTAINNGAVPVTATIAVTPLFNGCPGVVQTFNITVWPTPTVAAPPDQMICHGANTSAVIFSGVGTTFSWINNNTAIGLAASGSGNIPPFTAVNNGIMPIVATVTVTPIANGCIGPPQVFSMTVNPVPVMAAPANQVLCSGAATTAVTFTGSVSGATYSWTNNNTAVGLAASGIGDIASFTAMNNSAAPLTATIAVTPSANGCAGPVQNFSIQVNPLPDVTDPADQTVCHGDNTMAVVFASGVSGASFAWTNDNTSIGLPAAGNGNIAAFSAINNGITPETAVITVTSTANGCSGAAQTFTYTVHPTPMVADPPDQLLCNGASTAAVIFTGSVSGAAYTWTNDAPGIGLAAGGTGNIPAFTAINNGVTPVTATIVVTPVANGCAGVVQTFQITVWPTPTVVDPPDQILCNSAVSAPVLFSGSVGSSIFTWVNDNSAIGLAAAGMGDIPAFSAVNSGNTPLMATVAVTPFANGCIGASQTFTITVNPTPDVQDPLDQILCNGENTLPVTFTGNVAGTTFDWTNNNTGIGLGVAGAGNLTSFVALNTGTAAATATITVSPSAQSCAGPSQSFTITVNPTPGITCPANVVLNVGLNACTEIVDNIAPVLNSLCAGATVAYTLNGATLGSGMNDASQSVFNLGQTVVAYTVTDAGGGANTCAFQVTINDAQIPVITCPGAVAQNTEAGLCTSVVNGIVPVMSDNCAIPVLQYSIQGASTGTGTGSADGFAFQSGASVVTYTATDAFGNTATCAFGVMVADIELPAIFCPANLIHVTDPGVCTAVVGNIDALFSDNCAAATLTYSAIGATFVGGSGSISNTTFNLGFSTVIYLVTDNAGNTASCSFTVTIRDQEAPLAICPSNVSLTTPPGQCFLPVSNISGVFTDDCSPVTTTYAFSGATTGSGTGSANGTSFNAGVTTLVYTAADGSANTSSCSLTITITDNVPPAILCPTNKTVTTDPGQCTGVVSGINAVVADNCGVPGLSYSLSGATTAAGVGNATGLAFEKGITLVTYTATDAFMNSASCAFTVNVADQETPLITCPAGQTVSTGTAGCTAIVNNLDVLVSDNCPGTAVTYQISGASTASGNNTASGSTFELGSSTVTYTVTDASGNTAGCITVVVVNDDQPPVFQCPPPPNASCTILDQPVFSTAVAFINAGGLMSDNCGLNMTSFALVSETSDNMSCPETVTRLYAVTDLHGNTSNCTQLILMNDITAPVLTLTGNNPVFQCSQVPYAEAGATALDDCGGNLSNVISITGAVDVNTPGTYLLTYAVTDACGNNAVATRTVVVNNAPVLQIINVACAPNLLTYTTELSSNGSVVTSTAGTVTDNGGGSFTIGNIPAGQDVTISSMDVSGCITVQAVTAPVCTCGPVSIPVSNGDLSLCAGSPITPLEVGGFNVITETIDWYDAASGGNLLLAGNPQYTPAGPGTFWAETRNLAAMTCVSSLRTGVTLTIHALPVVTIDDPGNQCENAGPVTLAGAPAGGNFSGTGVSGGQFDPAVAQAGAHVLAYEVTDGNGCSNTATVSIQVWAIPQADAGADAAACLPSSVPLNASATGLPPILFQWNNPGSLSDPSIANPVASPQATVTYLLTVTDGHGCSDTDDVTVNIGGLLTADAGPDLTVCKGTPVQLLAQTPNTGNLVYSWNPPAFLDDPSAPDPVATPDSNTTYTITILDAATGCSGADDVTIEVLKLPEVLVASSSPICTGEALLLSESGGDAVEWSWTGPNGFASTENNPVINPVSVLAGDYIVEITDTSGCTNTATAPVSFVSGAGVSFESKFLVSATACVGDTIRFIEISDTVATGATPTAFEWSFGDGGTSNERDPAHIYIAAGAYDISVTVYNQSCQNFSIVKTLQITDCKQAGSYNTFIEASVQPSLNNGIFEVTARLQYPAEMRMEVYNSFGRLVESRNKKTGISFNERFEVDTSGIYFVKLLGGLGQSVKMLKVVAVRS